MTARYLSALLGLLAACAPESTPASDAVQAEVGPSETRSDVAADTETSDSSSIPPPQAFESGQPDDTQANELTPAEQTAFCAQALAYFNDSIPKSEFKKLSCTLTGFAFASFEGGSCSELTAECLASDEDFTFDEYACDTGRLATCAATIGEVEACYTASVEAVAQIAPLISCSMTEETLAGFEDEPAACATVRTKCPDLFESEDR